MRVSAPPIAVPTSAPMIIMTARVAQSSLTATSRPINAPRTMKPVKMSFRKDNPFAYTVQKSPGIASAHKSISMRVRSLTQRELSGVPRYD